LSQALFNEPLKLLYTEHNRLKIEALEQKIYNLHCDTLQSSPWQSLPGFIKKEKTIAVENLLTYNVVVKETWSNLYEQPDDTSHIIIPVCIATKLHGSIINDHWVKITLPKELHTYFDIGTCYIPRHHVFMIEKEITQTIDQIRLNLVTSALLFLDNPYCWGHRSDKSDCSGFTNLVYRINGFQIPKNSTSQWKACTPLDGNQMQPGDMIFFAKPETPYKTCHAMLYLGNGNIIECTGLVNVRKTRIVSDVERLGKKMEFLENGSQQKTKYGTYIIYFGTYLDNIEKLQKKRLSFAKGVGDEKNI
jgi:hypothetical protein